MPLSVNRANEWLLPGFAQVACYEIGERHGGGSGERRSEGGFGDEHRGTKCCEEAGEIGVEEGLQGTNQQCTPRTFQLTPFRRRILTFRHTIEL